MHGRLIDEIGYHCRDYFLGQWDRFQGYPGGILAHSTHVKGVGSFDSATGTETPRMNVTLATGIPQEHCAHVNLGYSNPARFDRDAWSTGRGTLVVERAGEQLYRLGKPPA